MKKLLLGLGIMTATQAMAEKNDVTFMAGQSNDINAGYGNVELLDNRGFGTDIGMIYVSRSGKTEDALLTIEAQKDLLKTNNSTLDIRLSASAGLLASIARMDKNALSGGITGMEAVASFKGLGIGAAAKYVQPILGEEGVFFYGILAKYNPE